MERVAVVTGGNAGIGLETVRSLLGKGVMVIFGSRNQTKNEQVLQQLRKGSANVSCYKLDLSDSDSIKQFSQFVRDKVRVVDLLINNAGIIGTSQVSRNKAGVEMQFATNHLGHFLLTMELYPLLKQSKEARIINLSSGAHFSPSSLDIGDLKEAVGYSSWSRYCQTKLCNVLFTVGLAQRLALAGVKHVRTFALHPGVVDTDIFDGSCLFSCLAKVCGCCFKSPRQGSVCSVFLATHDSKQLISGEYYDSDCSHKEMNPLGRDKLLQDRLWQYSQQLLQSKFQVN